MKVKLLIKPSKGWRNPDSAEIPLKVAPPYFYSPSRRVHRVRSAKLHYWLGNYRHTSLDFWCGGGGFLSNDRKNQHNRLMEVPPENLIYCATCEGRAIGAGQDESRMLAGKFVVFSPRI